MICLVRSFSILVTHFAIIFNKVANGTCDLAPGIENFFGPIYQYLTNRWALRIALVRGVQACSIQPRRVHHINRIIADN